ncbi:rod shape-determining protein MreD [Flavihumibacter stibioxidans]|uniref:Rod shape-determining protein MreD n=1 Tax=Flavihumibacter stibioxidans TaxID=1834163 RepID=A0ABR7M7E6_9BACT|nr:rod shape-determining protein MreD [Flavihumibacter stibioxidans]MBC6490932.1 rod shape-determining protein MreD [Flavihumibacter stibioxidans]
MSNLVRNTIRFILFILVQVYILHKIPPLHRFIVPYLYFLYILWLPFSMSRGWLMVVSFFFGLSLDYFLVTPGLHAAACVLIAYVRPFLVNLLIRQEGAEQSYGAPSINSMGWAPYFIFVLVLTLLHHGYLVFLEWMQFGNFWYFLGKVAASSAISLFLVLITELLFNRKEKYRTNAA